MRIYISESKLHLLKESNDEVTFYSFFTNVKNFIQELLVDPINAKPNDFLRAHGFNRSGLVKKLVDRGIITKKEDIKEVSEEGDNKQSKYSVQFKVPKKNFEKKMHRLYSRLFEGDYDTPVFSNQEKMIHDIYSMDSDNAYRERGGVKRSENEIVKEDGEGGVSAFGGATNSNISAAAMYDTPFGGVQRKKFYSDTLKRNKDSKNKSISMNRE